MPWLLITFASGLLQEILIARVEGRTIDENAVLQSLSPKNVEPELQATFSPTERLALRKELPEVSKAAQMALKSYAKTAKEFGDAQILAGNSWSALHKLDFQISVRV